MTRPLVTLFTLLALAGAPTRAEAQAELSGTYINYLGTRANGTMVNAANHSMRYSETGAAPYSCDAFFPGAPVEGFTVEATGTAVIKATNSYLATEIPAIAGPTVAGRTITWSGQYTSGLPGVRVDQVMSYAVGDRYLTIDVTLTNTGTVALTNLYYLRNGDPDFGNCDIGSSTYTLNDVIHQPAGDASALVTATAGTTPAVTLGIGATDVRARVTATGFANTDASGEWAAPVDPNGVSEDIGVDIVFREPSLAVAGVTTFRIYYVWGATVGDVTSRFDGLACAGLPDGTACSGGAGQCHAGVCCTGCWDGAACQSGTTAAVCGDAGGACASCVDGNGCTSDTCTAAGSCVNSVTVGAACNDGQYCTVTDTCTAAAACVGTARNCSDGLSCTNDSCDETGDGCIAVVAPGTCLIAGTCRVPGDPNPANECEQCAPGSSALAWSPVPSGVTCDDGAYCTDNDACDGAGACAAAPRNCSDGLTCTTDACDEAGDACVRTLAAGSCLIGGVCWGDGANPLGNVCLRCDPGESTDGWTLSAPSTACDDGLFCTTGDVCGASGTCAGAPRLCNDGLDCTAEFCDEAADACLSSITADSCVIDGDCVAAGTEDPAATCAACLPETSQVDWSPRPAGERCGDPACADGTLTPAAACDGEGACAPGVPESCGGAPCADAVSCDGDCAGDLECLATHHCGWGGECEPDLPAGAPCDRAEACATGMCVEGACCEAATCPAPVDDTGDGGCGCRAARAAGSPWATWLAAALALLAALALRRRR
jgi:hypothetical protein